MQKLFIAFILLLAAVACKDERSELGDRYFKRGKYDKAIQAYTEYLKLEPSHIKSLYNRGRAYEELEQYEKALADFNSVIKKDPANINAYLSIARDYYYRQNDYENAIFYADKALKVSDNTPVAHTLQGKAYQKLGKLEEAMAAYNAAISVDQEHADAYLSRGMLRLHLNQTSRACADFAMAGSLGAKSAEKIQSRYCR